MLMRHCWLANITSNNSRNTNNSNNVSISGSRSPNRRRGIKNSNKAFSSSSSIISVAFTIGNAAIYFWLLTQAATVTAQQQHWPHSAIGNSRAHLTTTTTTTTTTAGAAQMRYQRETDKSEAATFAAGHAAAEDASLRCRHPVCATNNGRDHVVFASACLLRETNRERYLGPTVFREIALGACRPDCNVICGRSSSGNVNGAVGSTQRPLCAREVHSDRMLSFGSDCAYARHVCLSDTEWLQVDAALCTLALANSTDEMAAQSMDTTTAAPIPESTTAAPVDANKATPMRKQKPRKSIPCPKVFNPVCATLAGVKSTFINECLVNAENVRTGAAWQIFSTGVCAEDYASSGRHGIISDKNTIQRRRRRHALNDDAFAYAPFASTAELAALGEDVIWAPPIVHTQYVDDDDDNDAVRMHSPMQQYHQQQRPLMQHAQSDTKQIYANATTLAAATTKVPMLHTAQTTLPIRIIGVVDDKVHACKFGAASVCGRASSDAVTRTFGNVCELMLRNIVHNQTWSVLHEGACKSCTRNCTMEFKPICVSRNGLNYTIINECYLNYGICQDKQRSVWQILSRGECPGTRVEQSNVERKYDDSEPGFRYTSSYGATTTATTPIAATATATTAKATTATLPYRTSTTAQITKTTPAAIITSTAATPITTAATRPPSPSPSATTTPTPSLTISSKSCPFQLPSSGNTNSLTSPISPPMLWLYPPIINTARFLIGANGWPYLVSSTSTATANNYGAVQAICARNKAKCACNAPDVPKLKRGVSVAPSKRTHIMNLVRPKCRCARKSQKAAAAFKSST